MMNWTVTDPVNHGNWFQFYHYLDHYFDYALSFISINGFQEQPDNQKLDDDEDRKNPAFIPRQGAFYEHDLRLGEELEDGDK